MLTFLTPWWGAAMLAALGVPLLAHLLSRKGGRLAVFPAVRFVGRAAADAARVLRPRHRLLMALRTALLTLVVLAFMQPVWHGFAGPLDAAAGGGGVRVAVLVDRSASMRRTRRGATLFDEARRQAAALLNGLDPTRDLASVILVDRHPRPLLPEPSAHFSELIRRLGEADAGYQRGRLADALRIALALADRGDDRPLRIEVFTDMQASSWSVQVLASLRSTGAVVRFHRVGEAAPNLAVSRPAIAPARPIAGQPATLSAEVSNHSSRRRTVAVAATIGERTQRQTVTIEAWGSSRVGWRVSPDRTGPMTAEFAIVPGEGGDALAADNAAGLVASVARARPVTLVTRASPDDPDAAVYFVSRAVSPRAGGDAAGVALEIISPAELAAAAPAEQSAAPPGVVIVVEAGRVQAAGLASLRRHLERGGGVVWIVDSPAAAESLARFGDSPIVPRTFDGWSADRPRALGSGRFDNPVLGVFEGPGRSALLRQRFAGSLRGTLAPRAEVLLSFADGEPAAASRWVGPGRLTVLGVSLAPRATGLVKGPLLVPLIHQLIRHSAPGLPVPPNPHPGEALGLHPQPGQWMRGPDGGELAEPGVAGEPGLYAVVERSTGAVAAGTWVEIDPAESDLRGAQPPVDGVAAETAVMDGAADARVPPAVREPGMPLWPYAMLGALLLACAETLVLWGMSRPRGLPQPRAAWEEARRV